MLKRYNRRHEPQKEQVPHNSESEKIPIRDKKETKELYEEKQNKTDKSEKAEKSESLGKEQQTKAPEREEVKIYFVKFNEKSEKMLLTPVARKVGRGLPLENTM